MTTSSEGQDIILNNVLSLWNFMGRQLLGNFTFSRVFRFHYMFIIGKRRLSSSNLERLLSCSKEILQAADSAVQGECLS